MNCNESHELFADYIGEELSPGIARQLKIHLEGCSQCQQELAGLLHAKAVLQEGWPEEAIPQNLTFELAGSPKSSFWPHWLQAGIPRFVWAAACLILCIVSLALVKTQFQFENGGFRVSFGQTVPALTGRTATEASTLPVRSDFNRDEVQRLIDQSVRQLEQRQTSLWQQALLEIKSEQQNLRNADMRRIANELRSLESTQNIVYRQALSSSSYIETLARDVYLKTNSPAR